MSIDLSFDAAHFSGHVPLFPLPTVVLLPGGLLPLHVFEPRYREMVRDVLAAERLIAMALLKPGYEEAEDGVPAIEAHVCVGRIVLAEPLADGRFNVLLVGLRRARVRAEDHTRAYRLASVDIVEDVAPLPAPASGLVALVGDLLAAVPERLVRDPGRIHAARKTLQVGLELASLGVVLDVAADALHLGVRDRQALLGTPEVAERAALLSRIVAGRVREVEELRRASPWPPRPGKN